ncbi:hypothetical protein [Sphingobacterium anhuiense]|uniref:hypothetical protein n=1 Tax=Sphingobacterium anhuiense TaxID=493780 RepID=UPI003C2BCEE6
MKIILLLLAIILGHISSYGQNKNDDYKKMVDSAIVIQTMVPDKVPYRSGIYLLDGRDQAYTLTSDTHQKKFSYMNVYDKGSKSLLRKGVEAWKVLPVLSGNKLIVKIICYNITYKKYNYNFANAGGATVIFEYSCEKDTWIFKETKWIGI